MKPWPCLQYFGLLLQAVLDWALDHALDVRLTIQALQKALAYGPRVQPSFLITRTAACTYCV